MASSKPSDSMKRGQTAMVCQLCEIEQKIKWKCLECKIMICQRCKDKVHPKFASAENHVIIDIKDVGSIHDERKIDFTKLVCGSHGEKCSLYCRSCRIPICPKCIIAKSHGNHDLIDIERGFQIQYDHFKNEKQKIEGSINIFNLDQANLRTIRFLAEKCYEETKHDVLNYEEMLHNSVKNHVQTLLNDIDKSWNDISGSIIAEESRAKLWMTDLQKENEKFRELLETNDAKTFFSIDKNTIRSIDIESKPKLEISIKVPKFVQNSSTGIQPFLDAFGTLKTINCLQNTKIEVTKQFNTSLSDIDKVIICSDGSMLIGDCKTEIIQKVKPFGNMLQLVSTFKPSFEDMCLTNSGELLLAAVDSVSLKILDLDNQNLKKTHFNVSPLIPTAVHITYENKVIVGTADMGTYWPATGPRQLVVMHQTGRKENVFQFDSDNKPLFTLLYRITTNGRNNMGVIDWLRPDGTRRIMVLNQAGTIQNVYGEHPCLNGHDHPPFKPSDIASTKSNNFVVTDYWNHTLHVLNNDGELMKYYNIGKMGIEIPMSVSVIPGGKLYIGSAKYDIDKEYGKVHVIDDFIW